MRIDLAKGKLGPRTQLGVGHWIPDQPAALREAHSVLRKDRRLGFTTGDRESENVFQRISKKIAERPEFSAFGTAEPTFEFLLADGINSPLARKTGFRYHVDLHLEVDPEISVRASHEIAGRVREKICEQLPWVADVLIHVEPAPTRPGQPG